jgi:hypothetical protein
MHSPFCTPQLVYPLNPFIINAGLRVRVWVILYLFEHTRKDFQTEILLVP